MKGIKAFEEFLRVGLPPFLLACGWVAIWLLWPDVSSLDVSTRRPTMMTVRYVEVPTQVMNTVSMPDLFAHSSRFGFQGPRRGFEEVSLRVPDKEVRAARYLEETNLLFEAGAGWQGSQSEPDIPKMSAYRPVWSNEPVFNVKNATGSVVLVEMSGKLREKGFEVPALSVKELNGGDKPWRAVLFVEVNGAGFVRQVFMESGSGNKEIDSVLCNRAYQGVSKEVGTEFFGRVTIDYSPK